MKSAVALTYEMDDMKLAARQLASQIKTKLTLVSKSFGIVSADSEIDHKNLLLALHEELPIEIVGCTVMSVLDGHEGFREMCTSLIVMTGDDYNFSVTLSDPITFESVYEVTKKAYQKGANDLDHDVKLIFALPPNNLDIMLDDYPETLSKLSGGVPVYGGLPSLNTEFGINAVLGELDVHTDKMILLMLGGNIKPLFAVASLIEKYAKRKSVITKSDNNVVYTVDDMTFVDYCSSFGLPMERLAKDDNIFAFANNPIVIETVDDSNADGEPLLRTISFVNLEDGSGTAVCKVPVNSLVSIASLQKKDVITSSKQGIEALLKEIEENSKDGYEYSSIFCISCVTRFMVMTPDNGAEGDVLKKALPNGFNLSGFYGFGEICPTSQRSGQAVNRAHNESIVMLAL